MSIKKIAVLGAGQMGSGIALVAATAGFEVVIRDIKQEFCERGVANIKSNLEKSVAKGKLSQEDADRILASVSTTLDMADLKDVDMVIEAAPENLELKQKMFIEMGEILKEDAILATNTSSMSITDITGATVNPKRCVGMHFFFPVRVMKLVEIIRSDYTSDETVEAVREVAQKMGKSPVECKTDTPGFIVNRCLFAFMLEAIHCYEDGVATIEDIDTAIKAGLNHPLGPFEMMDMSGIDTFPHVTESLKSLPITTWECPESIKKLVAEGRYGRKSGEGWYKY